MEKGELMQFFTSIFLAGNYHIRHQFFPDDARLSKRMLSREITKLRYMGISAAAKSVNAQVNWVSDLGVGNGGHVSTCTVLGFNQKKWLCDHDQTNDNFLGAPVTNAQ